MPLELVKEDWKSLNSSVTVSLDDVIFEERDRTDRRCDNNCWFPQVQRDFLMARERIEFRFVSVSVLDEGTRWWPLGLDLSLQVKALR